MIRYTYLCIIFFSAFPMFCGMDHKNAHEIVSAQCRAPDETYLQKPANFALKIQVASFLMTLFGKDILKIIFEYSRTAFSPAPLLSTRDYNCQLISIEIASPDKILLGNGKGELIEWDIKNGKEKVVARVPHVGRGYFIEHIVRLNNNQYLLGTNNNLYMWNGNTVTQLERWNIHFLARVNDTEFIASWGSGLYQMALVHYSTTGLIIKKHFKLYNGLYNEQVVCGAMLSSTSFVTAAAETIKLWHIDHPEPLQVFNPDKGYICWLSSLSDHMFLSGSRSGVSVWSLGSLRPLVRHIGSYLNTVRAIDDKTYMFADRSIVYEQEVDKSEPCKKYNKEHVEYTPYTLKMLSDGRFISAGTKAHLWQRKQLSESEKAVNEVHYKPTRFKAGQLAQEVIRKKVLKEPKNLLF